MAEPKILSIVVPVYNEQEAIAPFLDRALPALGEAVKLMGRRAKLELIFVNDGSTDETRIVLEMLQKKNSATKLVNLSRNFGKEAAVAAGLNLATGNAVIPMDVDLQDPPELIVDMVKLWLDGTQVVNAKRIDRSTDSPFKRWTAQWFYRIYNKIAEHPIPANVGDFRLLDREAIDVIKQLNEQSRFNKGLFSWIGFRTATVEYQREKRSAGTSKWRYWRLWNLALDGITSSTTAPLRVWTYIGATLALSAFAYALYLVIHTVVFGIDSPGYASIMVVVLLMGGLNLLSLGILGEYLGRVATEVRRRPLYVIESLSGFTAEAIGGPSNIPAHERAGKRALVVRGKKSNHPQPDKERRRTAVGG